MGFWGTVGTVILVLVVAGVIFGVGAWALDKLAESFKH